MVHRVARAAPGSMRGAAGSREREDGHGSGVQHREVAEPEGLAGPRALALGRERAHRQAKPPRYAAGPAVHGVAPAKQGGADMRAIAVRDRGSSKVEQPGPDPPGIGVPGVQVPAAAHDHEGHG